MPTLLSDFPPELPVSLAELLLSPPPHAVSASDRMPAVSTAANLVLRRKTPPLNPPGRPRTGDAWTNPRRIGSCFAYPTSSCYLGVAHRRQRLGRRRGQHLGAHRHRAVVDAQ